MQVRMIMGSLSLLFFLSFLFFAFLHSPRLDIDQSTQLMTCIHVGPAAQATIWLIMALRFG